MVYEKNELGENSFYFFSAEHNLSFAGKKQMNAMAPLAPQVMSYYMELLQEKRHNVAFEAVRRNFAARDLSNN
ncbi:MAG TPA: hypothetical protein VLX91_10225 [Candidatus Acidoferrales bacterium]|nr:hypothetical protein [Candidatus Acidoferrales bacterium]